MKKAVLLVLGILFLISIIYLGCKYVIPSKSQTTVSHIENEKITTALYEINYDKNLNEFYFPLEHGIDRSIRVKNITKNSLNLGFRIFRKTQENQSGDILSFPQPSKLLLAPGEEQYIRAKIEWGGESRGWRKGESLDYSMTIQVFTGDNPDTDKNAVEVVLKNKLIILESENNAQNIKPNSEVEIKVVDAKTKKPIAGAQVTVWSDWPRVRFEKLSDPSGITRTSVFAYRRQYLGNWLEYSISVNSPGYEQLNNVFIPKTDRKESVAVAMVKETQKANYTLTSKYETGLPTYRTDFSEDGKYFATVPFHSSQPLSVVSKNAYLHFFSTDGTLLWRYKLDNEIPTVDVSDDGSLISTVHRPATNNWGGGDAVLVFNQKGDLIWKWEPERLPQDPPEGVGASEVRISHDKKHLAVGTFMGHFYLLDIVNKKVLWDTQLQGQIRYILFGKDDKEIYFGGDPYLYSYSINGKFNWRNDIGGWPYSLAISEHYLFAGAKAGQYLSLLNKDTGKIIWRYPIDARPDNLLIAPDESYFVYQSSNGGLSMRNAFFDKNGTPILNLPTARSGGITPDSKHLVYYSGQTVSLVNRNGAALWSAQLGGETWSAPNGTAWISDDAKRIVVANATNGVVYFFTSVSP